MGLVFVCNHELFLLVFHLAADISEDYLFTSEEICNSVCWLRAFAVYILNIDLLFLSSVIFC